MSWNIVADSSCDLKNREVKEGKVLFSTVPFVINVGSEEYIDEETLDIGKMMDAMEHCKEASHTSCPSPGSWHEKFLQGEDTFAITISSNLSGSYSSACAARDMIHEENSEKRIHIVDSRSTGPMLIMINDKLHEMIEKGLSYEEIVEKIEEYRDNSRTVFALCSFHNLVKNGRMSRIAGFVASKLGFWGLGIASPEGTIIIKDKMRGTKKAIRGILEDMKERGIPKEKVVISHCDNLEAAKAIQGEVEKNWPGVKVEAYDTRGLCSYYAERHGLIISYI